MPAHLSVSTLLNLNSNMTAPGTNGFSQASRIAAAGEDLVGPVVGVIAAGTGPAEGGIWSGAGQPEATVVLRTNGISIETAKVEMDAANTAVVGLEAALIDGRTNLRKFIAIADDHGIDIAEDGKATYRDPDSAPPGAGDPDLERLTLTIREILKLATIADIDAKRAFERITQNTPPSTDTADPGKLEEAKAAYDQALEDRQSIAETAALWEVSHAPTWDDYVNGYSGDKATNQELDYVLDAWATFGPGNHSLLSLLRDGFEGAAFAAGQSLFLKLFDPKKLAGRVLGPVGIGQLALEGLLGLYSVYADTDDGKVGVNTNGGPNVRVFDEDLAKIASQYYPKPTDGATDGSGTLADRVRYEQVTSGPTDPTPSTAKATQTRADLQAWLDSHPDDADSDYVKGLIADLDDALATSPG